MKYIIATTDSPYFRWQILVQINNFKKLGILDDVIFLISKEKKRSKELGYIQKETGANILTFKDERKYKNYASSVRPNMMKRFVIDYPEIAKCFFYLDPDVIFTEKIEYPYSVENNEVWYLSDTKSYIDSSYIKSKGNELFIKMCEIVDIEPNIVQMNDLSAGGAQYIMKNTNYEYWDKVEKDSELLYKFMNDSKDKYNPKHPIQAWTADMWAVLWNAWKFNHKTIIWNNLNFSWATSKINQWDENKIFHNAGVFTEKNLFNKCNYVDKHPFDKDFSYVEDRFCSFNYVKEIKDTKNNYSSLIKKI
jgi:hypothetical protein